MKLEKHRYVVFKYYAENEITKEEFIKGLWNSIYEVFGCKGASETGLWIIEFNKNEKKGILRCDLKSLIKIRVALTLITELPRNNRIMFQILGISGTIKKAKEKFY
ncbi:MAG: Rpp14/Pop5 family protein [Candidatus Helarchaeota archaeon]